MKTRLLALTPWGQLSAIDSPASYTPDIPSHAKHRVISIFVRMSVDTSAMHRSPGVRCVLVHDHVHSRRERLPHHRRSHFSQTGPMASLQSDTLLLRQSMKFLVYGLPLTTFNQ